MEPNNEHSQGQEQPQRVRRAHRNVIVDQRAAPNDEGDHEAEFPNDELLEDESDPDAGFYDPPIGDDDDDDEEENDDDDNDDELQVDDEGNHQAQIQALQPQAQIQPQAPPQQQEDDHPMPVLAMNDPRRMQLTRQERGWALAIKAAIEATPEIDNLNDFNYAQLALVERDNIEGALERAQHMQEFRREYRVADNYQDGLRSLAGVISMFPRHILSFSYLETEGHYVFIYDITEFDVSILSNPEKLRTWLGGAYYIMQVANPDMEAIRRGMISLAECEGYHWNNRKSIDIKSFKQIWSELIVPYPTLLKQIKSFHTGVFANILFSMLKRFMPPTLRSKVQVGGQFEGRFDTLYLVPNVETANARVLHRMARTLQLRYENERHFTLSLE